MYYMVMANVCNPSLSLDEVHEITGAEMRHMKMITDPEEILSVRHPDDSWSMMIPDGS